MPVKSLALFTILFAFLVACSPTPSAEDLAVTYVAATADFTTAVAEAVGTGIAATIAAQPTDTPTTVPTKTPEPTATATSTSTLTSVPTETQTPTITYTPEPTETNTPSAADIKADQLYEAIRDMKYFAEQLATGLGGDNTGFIACSRELRISVVTNFEGVQKLPVFDDSLLSTRAVGANITYNLARTIVLEDANIAQAYNNCVAWIDAGKPIGFENKWGDNASALGVARRAINLVIEALNN